MKLDILIHELNLSGAPRTAQEVANYMAEKGHRTRMIVIGGAGEVQSVLAPNIECIFFRCSKNGKFGKVGYIFMSVISVARYLLAEKPSNLMVWGKEFTLIATLLSYMLFSRTKVIGVGISMIEQHLMASHQPVRIFKHLIYKLGVPLTRTWIAQSKGVADELVDKFGVVPSNVAVVYPALQKRFFEVPLSPSNNKTLVFVGRLVDEKNPKRLFSNCKNFLKMNKDWTLEIVGGGDLRRDMGGWVQDHDLGGRVIFHGPVKDVIPYIQKSRALLLTSRFEGFGMVLAEACALGVPVVSINCPGGPAEIVENGQNGYLAQNDQEFAQALEQIKTTRFEPEKVRESVSKFHPAKILAEYERVLTGVDKR